MNSLKGGFLDDEALIDAFDPELLLPNHPFLSLEPELQNRLILTPHLGGGTRQSHSRMFKEAMNNILRVMSGES